MISPKERGLIKGAIRRVFSRSETRLAALKAAIVPHSDVTRPRVTKWAKCAICGNMEAAYKMNADHIDPVVPIDKTLEMMSWDDLVNRIFCDKENLQILCLPCHSDKTKLETKARAKARKDRKCQTQNLSEVKSVRSRKRSFRI